MYENEISLVEIWDAEINLKADTLNKTPADMRLLIFWNLLTCISESSVYSLEH